MRKVALIGRPNVGKSSLFNRLLGQRKAIVEAVPGVTRDRHYGLLRLGEADTAPLLLLIDTGGFLGEKEGLEAQVAQQIRFAVEEADLLLWVVEASGAHPEDQTFAEWLRRYRRPETPLWLVVNKTDNEQRLQEAADLYRLGVEPVFFVSATSGRGIAALKEALRQLAEEASPEKPPSEGPRFALIGRPNAGKSSLLNALLRAPRAVVSDVPGTTRDTLSEAAEWQGRPFFWVDTAGLRRKTHIPPHSIERYAALRSLEALFTADVVLLTIDATEPLTQQEMTLLRQAERHGRGIVLLLNKMDLLSKKEEAALLDWATRKVQPLEPVPILAVSALTGRGVRDIPAAAFQVYEAGQYRIPTRTLNDTLLPILRQHPHPMVGTVHPSVRFIQQVGTAPPTFLLHVRHGDKLRKSYLDFVRRQIRAIYPFPGWWLNLRLKEENA
ncbi:MAG: ribosome biogenesis GTPase Der [Bacteroidia bacterium]|jgi:GTP-binding protein|nr:ribosome biogenesis GTPase Der [Bacteroidia bacterium]GIV24254.1 MAG: GTPase Der [Bacteroidia bacterium]